MIDIKEKTMGTFIIDMSYAQGYEQALLDVQNYFKKHSTTLFCCKMYNEEDINAILQMLIDNQEVLQETGDVNNVYYDMNERKFKNC